MADLVTHLCSVLLPGSLIGGRYVGIVAFGAVLPDLGARVPALGLELLHRLGVPVPGPAAYGFDVLHMPVGLALACIAAAYLFPELQRARVLAALLAGSALHLGLDVLQDHHGYGYYLLWPLSSGRWELAWIGSEATVGWAPWLALATAAAWGIRWALAARRAAPK